MLCCSCNIQTVNEQYRIELQKQNGDNEIIYFCGSNCIKQWKNARFCSVCNSVRQDNSEILNDIVICSDIQCKQNKIYPTCKEQYTGCFTCDLCNTTKQMNITNINNSSIEYAFIIADKSYETIYYYLCDDCCEKYNINIKNDQQPIFITNNGNEYSNWIFIHHTNLMYNFIINLFKLKEEQQGIEFICNMCDKYTSISEGINIINHKNLCNRCIKIKNKL